MIVMDEKLFISIQADLEGELTLFVGGEKTITDSITGLISQYMTVVLSCMGQKLRSNLERIRQGIPRIRVESNTGKNILSRDTVHRTL